MTAIIINLPRSAVNPPNSVGIPPVRELSPRSKAVVVKVSQLIAQQSCNREREREREKERERVS